MSQTESFQEVAASRADHRRDHAGDHHAGARHHDRQCRAADMRATWRAQDTITWVLTSYIVAAAIMTPVTGWLPDRFGRASCSWSRSSALPSLRCSAAWPGASRMVAVPHHAGHVRRGARAVVADHPARHQPEGEHGQAMAIWGAGIMLGPIIGPALGGWLTDSFNWRWVFLINLPVGILAFLLRFLPASQSACAVRFLRLRHAVARRRRAAVDARPRRAARLVRVREIWIELGLTIAGFWVFIVHC